MIHLIIVN